jgi:hypothetical protein
MPNTVRDDELPRDFAGDVAVSEFALAIHALKDEGAVVFAWDEYKETLHCLTWWHMGEIHYCWDVKRFRLKDCVFAIKPPFPSTRKQLIELVGRMNYIFSELVLPEYIKTTLEMMR